MKQRMFHKEDVIDTCNSYSKKLINGGKKNGIGSKCQDLANMIVKFWV